MSVTDPSMPAWLVQWMSGQAIELWGAADLTEFATPPDAGGQRLSYAVCWALPMTPHIMAGIQQGPNQAYADEYARVNARINQISVELVRELERRGTCWLPRWHAHSLPIQTGVGPARGPPSAPTRSISKALFHTKPPPPVQGSAGSADMAS